jgi:uncharacterized membrane protein YgcG
MKKLMFCTVIAFLMLSTIPTQLKAADDTKTTSATTTIAVETTDAVQLARLEEINAMDLSSLSRSEKKELRNEVKMIKSNQDGRSRRYREGRNYDGRHGGGTVFVYGGGGLLLIILLIILL